MAGRPGCAILTMKKVHMGNPEGFDEPVLTFSNE